MNRYTMRFRDRTVERNYQKEIDAGFSGELVCSLLLLMLSTALQVAVFPRTFILLLLFLTTFIWISSILMLMLAARLKWILWDLSHSFTMRLAIIVFTIILLYSVGQVNVVCVWNNLFFIIHKKLNEIFVSFVVYLPDRSSMHE